MKLRKIVILAFFLLSNLIFKTNISSQTAVKIENPVSGTTDYRITGGAIVSPSAASASIRIGGVNTVNKGGNLTLEAGYGYYGTNDNAGTISFRTNSLTRLFIAGSGNVGIGTSAPIAPFEISGKVTSPYNETQRTIRFYLNKGSKINANWSDFPTIEIETKDKNLQIIDKENGYPMDLIIGRLRGYLGKVTNGYAEWGYEINAGELILYDQSDPSNNLKTCIRAAGTSSFVSNVAIGCTDTKGYKLAVDGSVIAEKIVVKMSESWPDYVFNPAYKVPSLTETEKYIKEHNHLPGIPAQSEVQEQGIDLAQMNALLLKKLEEMTLIMIEQEKKVNQLSKEIEELKGK